MRVVKDCNALLKEISELEYSSKFKTTLKDYIKVRLHTAINQADFISWCMLYIQTKVTKYIREKMTLYTFIDKPLNHIRQNTKSARLIAVC